MTGRGQGKGAPGFGEASSGAGEACLRETSSVCGVCSSSFPAELSLCLFAGWPPLTKGHRTLSCTQARAEPAGPSLQAAPARPLSAAPAAGVAPKKPLGLTSGSGSTGGGMKLTSAKPKLGAQKLKPGDIDLESLLAD